MNRHLNWAITYSPQDKDNLKEHYQPLLQALNKNTNQFIIQYEEGSNSTNPHLDIVACFKSKQAKNDVGKKFYFLGKKPEVVYSVIADLRYRIGYNQKERLDSSFNHNFNIEQSFIDESIEHYTQEEIKRKATKAKYNLFTYCKESTFAYEINKYIINNKLEPPTEEEDLETVLNQMYLDGFIFNTIRKNSRQLIGRQIIHTYRKKKDKEYYLDIKNDKISCVAHTDSNVSYSNFAEQENLCSNCLSILEDKFD